MRNTIRFSTFLLTLLLFTQISCDSGGEPDLPQVAGTYSGDLIYELTLRDLRLTETARARYNVVQSGSTLTISGTINLLGDVSDIAAVTGEINATGFFSPTAGGSLGSYRDPTCGQITTTSSSLTFSGDNLRIQQSAVTDACGDISVRGVLVREM